jgi:RHS repeat-associated protein
MTTMMNIHSQPFRPMSDVRQSGATPFTNEVRFTGERTDTESGLEFLRARTYDPSTGTFLQRDTWGITATDSQSVDAYVYTANDPANGVDPSGHCGLFDPLGCASDAIGGVGNKVSDAVGGVGNAVTNPGQTWATTGGGIVNNVAGGANTVWQHTGGGIVNNVTDWVQKNPALSALIVGGIACAISVPLSGGTTAPLCLALAQGAAIGAATYTGGVVVKNGFSGKGLSLAGFNSEHLAINMLVGAASGGAGKAASTAVSTLSGSAGFSTAERLAIAVGSGGPANAAVSIIGHLLTNTSAPTNALSPITSALSPIIREVGKRVWQWLFP